MVAWSDETCDNNVDSQWHAASYKWHWPVTPPLPGDRTSAHLNTSGGCVWQAGQGGTADERASGHGYVSVFNRDLWERNTLLFCSPAPVGGVNALVDTAM